MVREPRVSQSYNAHGVKKKPGEVGVMQGGEAYLGHTRSQDWHLIVRLEPTDTRLQELREAPGELH